MPQDAYVWQRVWTDAVAKSVEDGPKQSNDKIREIVPLAAEVLFRNGQPSVIRPVLSYKALQSAPSCGLALRIGPVLCDSSRARQWAEKAASIGVPFRVALPTYTSFVALNREGKIMGVSSEGQRPPWPADYRVVTARPDARQLAELVQAWTQDRPANLTGHLWYRLPVSSDSMNWRWPTLAAVMKGYVPKSSFRVDIPSGNPSDSFSSTRGSRRKRCLSILGFNGMAQNLIAADALNGFVLESAPHRVIFNLTASGLMLAVRERRMIGWVRIETPTKIYVTEN